MEKSYSEVYLNTTAQKWLDTGLKAPAVDCRGCHKLTKCCAFQPFIPNYLLGGLIEARNWNSLPQHKNLRFEPIGAIPEIDYREKHARTENKDDAIDLLCSFYQGGQCSIWEFRPGECSTYYCDDQMTSEPRQRLSKRVFDTEIAVSQMALVEIGLSPVRISEQVDICNTSQVTQQKYSDQELIFMYKQAWSWSQQLTSEQVQAWSK